MWLLGLVRRWSTLSNGRIASRLDFPVDWKTWSLHAYLLLRLLKRRLSEILTPSPPHPYRLLRRRTTSLTHLPSFHHRLSEGPPFVKLFSTFHPTDSDSVPCRITREIARVAHVAQKAAAAGELPAKESFLEALDQFQQILMIHHADFNFVTVVTMIHRIGALTQRLRCNVLETHPRLMSTLMKDLWTQIPKLQVRHVSSTILALGRIRLQTTAAQGAFAEWDVLLPHLLQQGLEDLEHLAPQHVANILVGLIYHNDNSCREMIPRLVRHARSRLGRFKPNELSSMIWALAKMEFVDLLDFWPRAFEAVDALIDQSSSQQMAIVMWSMVMLCYPDCDDLIQKMLNALIPAGYQSHTLAIVLWSLLELQIRPDDDEILKLLNNCWRFGRPDYSAGEIRDFAMVLMVLADFGHLTGRTEKLAIRLRNAILSGTAPCNPQDICTFLWSLVIMDAPMLQAELVSGCFERLQQLGLGRLRDEDVRQFYQCLLHLRVFRPFCADRVIPPSTEQRWRAVWSTRQATSPLPLWVAAALVVLEDMGYSCKGRFLEQGEINTCTIDLNDRFKYAIEGISFPRSYRNKPTRPVGRVLWKIRLLEAMGYEVMCIRERDWNELTGLEEKKVYLRSHIKSARANTFKKIMKAERDAGTSL